MKFEAEGPIFMKFEAEGPIFRILKLKVQYS